MQRATAAPRKYRGALSFGLALPLSFAAAAQAEIASVESVAAADEGMQQWRAYALQAITPDFSWSAPVRAVTAPSLFERTLRTPGARTQLVQWSGGRSSLSLGVESSFVGERGGSKAELAPAERMFGDAQPGLHRTLLAPAYSLRVGDRGLWSVTAVLAYQRFASGDLGAVNWNSYGPPAVSGADEVSFGRGVRVDYAEALSDRLQWSFGYQSRVNMDAFNNFRGVFADPGDFDIPASASTAVNIGTASPFSVSLGVERVMYSAIRPFTSASLPRRFLALLGDSTSPVFAWRDLTVYSIGGNWHGESWGDLSLRYSTREQPSPTSRLLAQLLDDGRSANGVELGYARSLGRHSRLELMASYSPVQYVLGAPTSRSVQNDYGSRQVEFEALWSVAF